MGWKYLPSVIDFNVTGNANQIIELNGADFIENFNDPDNDDLIKIKITSLPSKGTLRLAGTPVINDQEISTSSLSLLVFEPE